MDTIITIVVIAAAIIFKVVGKKLSTAAGDEVFPTIPMEPDMMNDLEPLEENYHAEEPVHKPEPVVVTPVFEEAQSVLPLKNEVKKTSSKKKCSASILNEDAPKKKEKIDPKKLIVYSEIMKPKYLE